MTGVSRPAPRSASRADLLILRGALAATQPTHPRLDAVERRTAADLLAMETVISWLKDNHDRTTASLESLARGVTP